MNISLIITVLNEADSLEALLVSVEEQRRRPDEVVIVDGGSSDGTWEQLQAWQQKWQRQKTSKTLSIQVAQQHGNRSVGRNHAIELASYDWLAVTDAGCVLDTNWLHELEATANANPEAQVIAGYYQGEAVTSFQQAVVPYALVMPDRVDPESFLPATRSMMLHRLVWEKYDSFDESLSDNEDYALARELKAGGETIVFARQAVVWWRPPSDLLSFFWMLLRFARGDAQAGLFRPKVLLLFLRYVIGVVTTGVLFLVNVWLALSFVISTSSLYAGWAVVKNKRFVPNGWRWLPTLQLVSDGAVMIGTLWGLVKRRAGLVFMALFILSSILYLAGVMRVGTAIWGDTHYYYAYTRSLVMDGDIDFYNESQHPEFGFPNGQVIIEQTSRTENVFSPGAPLLWLPGFLVGRALTQVANVAGATLPTDGYSLLTQVTVGVSTVLMSVAGLWLVYRSLLTLGKRNGDVLAQNSQARWLTVTTLLVATPVFFYTALDPFNSHSASLLLSSLALWLSTRLLVSTTHQRLALWLCLGVALGWLGLVRNQDILLVLPIGLVILFRALQQRSAYELKQLVLFSIGVISIFSIQVATTYYLYGQFGSPYTLRGQMLNWGQPDIIRVLFSQGNGLLYFAPALLLALYGLVKTALQKNESLLRTLAMAGLSYFLLELYVIASWGPEIVGGPYGSRMFMGTLPWLAVGLFATLASIWSKKAWRFSTLLLLALAASWSWWQTAVMLMRY